MYRVDFGFNKRMLKYSLEILAEHVDDSVICLSKSDLSAEQINELFSHLTYCINHLSDYVVQKRELESGYKDEA